MLGETLRQARLKAQLTQEALAVKAGLSREYVSKIESGHQSPTVETLLKLCQAIGVRASDIIRAVESSR